MTCDCKQENKETDGNCGDGMKWDAAQGKCVATSETKAKEQLGDPKSTSTQGEFATGDPGDKPSDITTEPCDEGHTMVDGICQPTDKKDPGDGQTQGTDKTQSVEKIVATQIAALKKDLLGEKTPPLPTAQVSSGKRGITEYKDLQTIADDMLHAISEGQNYVFHIPLDYLRSMNVGTADPSTGLREAYRGTPLSIHEAFKAPNRLIHEAVAISGTHATQDLDTDVAIVPGGISFIPVFQFAKVKRIEQGFDRARFFKSTLPGRQIQTVGTTATEDTQTITSIEVTPFQIFGTYLVGDYDLIENSPFDLLQTIVEGAAAGYEDFVATDMLDTVSAEGTLTPGLWINGATGATISSSDIAATTLDETGVAFGREYLENQGYLRGGIKPVMVMHPRQWRELITSTNVISLATRSVPDIWLKAKLEEFMGVQLVVSNAVENQTAQTNNAYNALMFIPKHSYGIAVKRDVTVKFHDYGEDNQVRVNTTWRTKSGVIDSLSIVRISTTAP